MVVVTLEKFNEEAQKGSPTFELEYFDAFSPRAHFKSNFPVAEMLFRPQNGQNPEEFFQSARANGKVVEADLAVFELAIQEHMRLGHSVSINLNAETFFDDRLLNSLTNIKRQHPALDPQNIWLEITEQGGIPKSFNPQSLTRLNKLGFNLALDDFNPHDPQEHFRLWRFAPYVQAVKMPFQVIEELKLSVQLETLRDIRNARQGNQDVMLVMEGYREEEHKEMSGIFMAASIDIVQHSSYVPRTQKQHSPMANYATFSPGLAYCG